MPKIHTWDRMDRFECPDCHVSGNDSGHQSQRQHGEADPDPGPASSSFLPLPALAFISAAGAACILANALLAAALLRARGGRFSGGEKALVLRRRIRGLLLNLALADLLTVALLAPFEVSALSKDGAWDFGAYFCRLFLGAEVLLGSAASYALAALALHAVHFWGPWPFVSFSWLLSASLSVPVFVLADVVSLPSSPFESEPQPHCSLPLAMVSGSPPRSPDGGGGSVGTPMGLLLLRLTGAALGFMLPTLIVLVSNVEAVVAYVRSDPGAQGQEEEAAVRELEDESFKLCFVLSLTHVLSTFPRFAYSLIFLMVPDASFSSSALRIPPLASPAGMPSAFFMAVLHYSAPAIRPAVVVATSSTLRKALFSTSLSTA